MGGARYESLTITKISEQGNICIDILKSNWSPALSLFKVMLSLSSLLTDPNPSEHLSLCNLQC